MTHDNSGVATRPSRTLALSSTTGVYQRAMILQHKSGSQRLTNDEAVQLLIASMVNGRVITFNSQVTGPLNSLVATILNLEPAQAEELVQNCIKYLMSLQ